MSNRTAPLKKDATVNTIDAITLEVTDTEAAQAFYDAAFGLGDRIRVRATDAPSTGFRGYSISLVVAQPSTVDSYMESALAAGATAIKPAEKSLWGYGGVLEDPFGTIWKIATSLKKDTGPAVREVDDIVLGIGVADVAATKQCYIDHGFTVAKSFGRKYVEFAAPEKSIKLSLYSRKFAAKTSFVSPDGSGSHRIAMSAGAGTFTDPDGFEWEAA